MSLKSRVLKIEERVATKDQPNWLFITIVSADAPQKVMRVTDINHIYPGTFVNENDLPNDEFLKVASNHFGVDMVKEFYGDNEYIEWGE